MNKKKTKIKATHAAMNKKKTKIKATHVATMTNKKIH